MPLKVEVHPVKEGRAEADRAKRCQAALEKRLQPHLRLMEENLKRVVGLVELSGEMGNRPEADDVLRAAVVLAHAYLEDFLRTVSGKDKNFSDIKAIENVVVGLGLDLSKHNQDFPLLDTMISRRHQIVHRADRVKATPTPGHDTYRIQPIQALEVQNWLLATYKFMAVIVSARVRVPEAPEECLVPSDQCSMSGFETRAVPTFSWTSD